jgi:hypothetical protein
MAGTAGDFAQCIKNAEDGQTSEIDVTAQITCDGGSNVCSFKIDGKPSQNEPYLRTPLLIRGTSGSNGFYRLNSGGDYGSDTLTIENTTAATPVTLQTLTFYDGLNQPLKFSQFGSNPWVDVWTNQIDPTCALPQSTGADNVSNPCGGNSLTISKSSNVIVDHVDFKEAKNDAISISGSDDIIIRKSTFNDSFFHSIFAFQNNTTGPNVGIHIEDNVIENSRGNALVLSAEEPVAPDPILYNTISGNYFSNDTNTALFYTCGVHFCSGGTIAIGLNADTSSVLMENNNVRSLALPSFGGQPTTAYLQGTGASGVEISTVHSAPANSGIQIVNNNFDSISQNIVGIDFQVLLQPYNYGLSIGNNLSYAIQLTNETWYNGGYFQPLTQIGGEWFLTTGQNELNNLGLPSPIPPGYPDPTQPGGNCGSAYSGSVNSPYHWDYNNCVLTQRTSFLEPSGTISVTPGTICTQNQNGNYTCSMSWSQTGGTFSNSSLHVVVNNKTLFGQSPPSGGTENATWITGTPNCFELYSDWTYISEDCIAVVNGVLQETQNN